MAGTATYNAGTRIIDVSANGLPNPVAYGTFPNADNPNAVTEQDFDHDFYYRGGTFGITRAFDSNTFTQNGYIIEIPLSVRARDTLFMSIQKTTPPPLFYRNRRFLTEAWLDKPPIETAR